MGARTRERAFDDFFTTKARGSGLGLAFVRRVMPRPTAARSLTSKEGSGYRLRLSFPLELMSDAEPVLVVDDDVAVGKVRRPVEQAGLKALAASSARGARSKLLADRGPSTWWSPICACPGWTGWSCSTRCTRALAGHPGHHAHRARHRGARGRGDEARRGRLPAQAVRPRGAALRRAQGARSGAPRRARARAAADAAAAAASAARRRCARCDDADRRAPRAGTRRC